MKKIIRNIRYKLLFLGLCLFTGVYAFAQENTDTLTSADYHVTMPKHLDPFYNGPLRFILMGVVIALILYISYRYYEANRIGKDIFHDPQ
jgi:hypothetical protein